MNQLPEPWRNVYLAMRKEKDPDEKLRLCAKARRLAQERTLGLAGTAGAEKEKADIQAALRSLWKVEQHIKKSQG